MRPINCAAALISPERDHLIDLNRNCFCLPLDRAAIDAGITDQSDVNSLGDLLTARSNLFAATPVFLTKSDTSAMLAQIAAFETLTSLKAFQRDIFDRSEPCGASVQGQTRGALMGYDFHITPGGPKLMEINTNAGGVFLVNAMHKSLNPKSSKYGHSNSGKNQSFESNIAAMFIEEWCLAGKVGKPNTIAIVDDDPKNQFLYPEMLLAQEALNRHGIETHIVDPGDLSYDGDRLRFSNTNIDMVYNRLTDFALISPLNTKLRNALLADQCVVTPAPRHHALFADKRNLISLGDHKKLATWGLAQHHIEALSDSLQTTGITDENADSLWRQRKQLFFKPTAGFGSRAVYRGSKLTRRVWNEIVRGNYVAQAYSAPTLRAMSLSSGREALKFDVRVYTYAGKMLLLAARVYQGQTTNFRTPGGGFAPVIVYG